MGEKLDKNWDGKERRQEGVSIPYPLLGIMFTLVLQTLGGVWWASAMSSKLGYLNDGQSKLEAAITAVGINRYTTVDAARDLAGYDRRFTILEANVNENKKLLTELQIKTRSNQ